MLLTLIGRITITDSIRDQPKRIDLALRIGVHKGRSIFIVKRENWSPVPTG